MNFFLQKGERAKKETSARTFLKKTVIGGNQNLKIKKCLARRIVITTNSHHFESHYVAEKFKNLMLSNVLSIVMKINFNIHIRMEARFGIVTFTFSFDQL